MTITKIANRHKRIKMELCFIATVFMNKSFEVTLSPDQNCLCKNLRKLSYQFCSIDLSFERVLRNNMDMLGISVQLSA